MKKELIAILFLFFLVFTSVSLLSHSPLDPSINHQSFASENIHNLFGLVGAHFSGVLVDIFGIASLWIPMFLFFTSFWYLKGRDIKEILIAVAGGMILMITTAGMLSIIKKHLFIQGGNVASGGFIGGAISDVLLEYTNPLGSIIILLFFIFAGVVLATGISASELIVIIRSFAFNLLKFVGLKAVETHSVVMAFGGKIKNNGTLSRENLTNLTKAGLTKTGLDKLTDIKLDLKAITFKSNSNQVDLDNLDNKVLSSDSNIADADFSTSEPFEEPSFKTGFFKQAKRSKKQDKISISPKHNDEFTNMEKSAAIEDGLFTLPPLSLLNDKISNNEGPDMALLRQKVEILDNKLKDFGVKGEIVDILPGPVITTFEYRPAPGVKISKIVNLTDDLALALSALSIRIVAPIPGKDVVGIEIPNDKREIVVLKELLASSVFLESKSRLTLALGRDIVGNPVSAAMDSMPHLLIAGATGTGKSVGLNSMIISLLYKAKPDEVKFIMVDPKRIELSVYDGIPHLISPVVTDMKKATNALFWAVREMERRYELLAQCGVRNLLQYNKMVENRLKEMEQNLSADASKNIPTADTIDSTQDTLDDDHIKNIEDQEDNTLEPLELLPYIVVIVDEFADLMMVASRDVESALIRLAQMARAAGIHLILATQRPSVDVLTGIIKANFPTRISFQVSSKIDSRTILDTNGSEKLLGNGDMLFLPPGTGRLQRIQGAYISEEEIARVTAFLKEQQQPDYVEDITEKAEDAGEEDADQFYDEKYDEAVALITKTRQASISSVQRHLRIGYNRAARIIETMEKEGIVGPQDGSKPREVLVISHSDR